MKILVTGGGGFIGSHAADYFASQNNQITVFDNLSRFELLGGHGVYDENFRYLSGRNSVAVVKGDVRSRDQLKKVTDDVDVIIHTAGQVAVTTSLRDPITDFETNVGGTINVLEACRENDSALIFCSTNKVYGTNVNSVPIREGVLRYEFSDATYSHGIPESMSIDQTNHSPYGCSKLAADLYVQDYRATYGLKTGVFRLSCIFGTRQYGVEDQGWLSWFARAAATRLPLTIYGTGKQVRDVLWVTDLVKAFELFIRRDNAEGVYNLGGGPENTVSLLELLRMLESLSGRKVAHTFSEWRPADQKVYVSDIRKATKQLGWTPTVKFDEGIRMLYNWILDKYPRTK